MAYNRIIITRKKCLCDCHRGHSMGVWSIDKHILLAQNM